MRKFLVLAVTSCFAAMAWAASANAEHLRLEQLELPFLADLIDAEMTRIAFPIRFRQHFRDIKLVPVLLPTCEPALH